MKIDELIENIDYTLMIEPNDIKAKAFEVALAALKAHKAGYRMYTYCYSERDLVEADCELNRLLEELER